MEIPDEGCRTARGYLVKVPVRWSDMDVFQHINHARMVTLLEEARIPWLFYDERPTAPLREGCVVVDLNVISGNCLALKKSVPLRCLSRSLLLLSTLAASIVALIVVDSGLAESQVTEPVSLLNRP